ncbi:hypothetical protein B5M47_01175 [candidate division CPR3 bacterium 4484_211]|uniref:PD-(D/E)XK endonuclease-like domain-containing protein n=1 Tax=candidate division CPR3 bacterium 4484_211 TaxID=1968527 RepID=A0A1W9P0J4_UNCC3|nr:MAG: hypothetical protein B5M47_01175 [candidate division CPR3 bacterium 4484_211]
MPDKFSATWISYTSINDFLTCPRAYFLKNVYRDPKTGHKVKIVTPALTLGQAVHEVLESLSVIPVDKRFATPLIARFAKIWEKYHGKRGGFPSLEVEAKYRQRGQEMIRRVINHPGPLANLAVKINMDLPYFWLSAEDSIILCGKIDWLEYLPETDSVHIIDFKTSKLPEDSSSLQLPIYFLIAQNCQKHKVAKASYWYLARNNTPTEVPLPDIQETREKILGIAKQIKLARQFEKFMCPHKNGCHACLPYEAILRRQAEFVGTDKLKRDLYVLDRSSLKQVNESTIL